MEARFNTRQCPSTRSSPAGDSCQRRGTQEGFVCLSAMCRREKGGGKSSMCLGNCRARRCVPITSQLVRRAWGSATFSFGLSSSTPIPSTVATRWAGSAHGLRVSPAIHCGDTLERSPASLARPCLAPPANVPYVHAPGGGPPRRGLGLGGLARLLGCCRKTSCVLCSTSGHRTRAQEQAWQRHHQHRLVPACNETRVAGEMSAEGQIWEPHR